MTRLHSNVTTEPSPVGPTDGRLSGDLRMVFSAQARLLASRAERGLPITFGSLATLVELGSRLDAELTPEVRP